MINNYLIRLLHTFFQSILEVFRECYYLNMFVYKYRLLELIDMTGDKRLKFEFYCIISHGSYQSVRSRKTDCTYPDLLSREPMCKWLRYCTCVNYLLF